MADRRWTTSDFDYPLPDELIAQIPTAERGESRMLVVDRGGHPELSGSAGTGHDHRDDYLDGPGSAGAGHDHRDDYLDGPGSAGAGHDHRDDYLDGPGSAGAGHDHRDDYLDGPGSAGAGHDLPLRNSAIGDDRFRDAVFADILSLIPPGDLLVVNSTKVRHARLHGTRAGGGAAEVLLIHPAADDSWIAMGKPGKAMQPGKRIDLTDGISIETIEVFEDGMRRVRFIGADATEAINRFGKLPLPPYITRDPTDDDERRYQTIYARREGSVAAPTAGLHFTGVMMAQLAARGVATVELDLEVGPGTFKPVEGEEITSHPMHAERFEIPTELVAAVAKCRATGGGIWAVGTTVVRALESAATADGRLREGQHETRLMITPGFSFRVVDHLITNFHLPRSTLLMLVAAFAGYETTMAAYRHAVAARYRFYSYGDAMCIL